jgi:hypothetical protein
MTCGPTPPLSRLPPAPARTSLPLPVAAEFNQNGGIGRLNNEDRYDSVPLIGVDRGAPPDQGPVAATTSSAEHTAPSANLATMIRANALAKVIITCASPSREEPLSQARSSLRLLAPRFENQVKGGLGRAPRTRRPPSEIACAQQSVVEAA